MDNRVLTGCTLLDLVVGGGQGLGFPAGKVINIVGDKSTGKTFLACELIAANVHRFSNNRLKFNYDDGENGFTFDTEDLYGIPMVTKTTLQSSQVEDFDTNTSKFLKGVGDNEIGIYVLDTLDGLSNAELEERSDKRYKAAEKGETFDEGTYGTKTPKFLSQEFFRVKTKQFTRTNTLLIIISQVRENIGVMFGEKYVRAGGKALDFFAHTCLWLAVVHKITKKNRVVGVVIKALTKKSKTPRPFRECMLSIYFDYGVDNIGSNLDYLYDLRGADGILKKAADTICWDGEKPNLNNLVKFLKDNEYYQKARDAKREETKSSELSVTWMKEWIPKQDKLKEKFKKVFGEPMTKDELIAKIEKDSKMERELERRVCSKWEDIEQSIKTDRKKKY